LRQNGFCPFWRGVELEDFYYPLAKHMKN